ncbi:hypothetical protein KIL84_013866 [Mauremys mutica]|uniref:Uncharacterized protein n=1 Tax=Mauremys mutica TaxID=74926 RepID=A0A9D4AUN8_9SAUR|nr:hypothetical protein KIL84_013866 [Mauremys mutica]
MGWCQGEGRASVVQGLAWPLSRGQRCPSVLQGRALLGPKPARWRVERLCPATEPQRRACTGLCHSAAAGARTWQAAYAGACTTQPAQRCLSPQSTRPRAKGEATPPGRCLPREGAAVGGHGWVSSLALALLRGCGWALELLLLGCRGQEGSFLPPPHTPLGWAEQCSGAGGDGGRRALWGAGSAPFLLICLINREINKGSPARDGGAAAASDVQAGGTLAPGEPARAPRRTDTRAGLGTNTGTALH